MVSPAQGEISVKRSRFIATLSPAVCEQEAQAAVNAARKQYWDAKHHCYAYILEGGITRCSDDGEPSGTAGRPILATLQGVGLVNIIAVVTRYFGGTLLGTGGLVRAYSEAVRAALAEADLRELIEGQTLSFAIEYSILGSVQNICAKYGIVPAMAYTDRVTLSVFCPEEKIPGFRRDIDDVTCGGAVWK